MECATLLVKIKARVTIIFFNNTFDAFHAIAMVLFILFG